VQFLGTKSDNPVFFMDDFDGTLEQPGHPQAFRLLQQTVPLAQV
jgi:hypothetical protein